MINNLIHPCSSSLNNESPKIYSNGVTLSNPSSVAAVFNDHYTSVADKLASKIPRTNSDPCSHVSNVSNSFVFFPTSSVEILKTITSFKSKGSHLQSIPSFIYKHIVRYISPILSQLINDSFRKGIFPDILIRSRVIPIFKSGNREINCFQLSSHLYDGFP